MDKYKSFPADVYPSLISEEEVFVSSGCHWGVKEHVETHCKALQTELLLHFLWSSWIPT